MNECVYLKFFVIESQRHAGQPVYQWLLRQAAEQELPGGSAFRAVAGFGRHHRLHESHFYELAGELPMEVVFVASREQVQRLIATVAGAGLSLFHYMMQAEAGTTGGSSAG